ncbi:Piso0_000776 [Millerozyma farinosa CBS 7064]|uniref:Protein AF-9 homolog n=1 Tax=Pichia sorbitophila (strain ATCC MYA-4447 / BCRC 22081 / CBS 7064 / NBRC 10061 / NRRL Y-12695) TaxID=559304 RepID=G8YRH3_PICSO|nr:Piso0_000776 [Millerozyma farinosa CBS 7064]
MSSGSRRIKNVSISVPILYGNHAVKLAPEKRTEKTPPDHTHEWTVFLKPVQDIDLSQLIKKVTFKLHETYDTPVRAVDKPPYEVTETGWGEFEIVIKIHFHSGSELGINEKNFQIFHGLKLHPFNPKSPQRENGEVHSVLYDELVFQDPTEKVFEILTQKPVNLLPYELSDPSKRDQEFIRTDEIDELARLDVYINKVKEEIENQRNEYKDLEQEKIALLQ